MAVVAVAAGQRVIMRCGNRGGDTLVGVQRVIEQKGHDAGDLGQEEKPNQQGTKAAHPLQRRHARVPWAETA